MAEFQHPAGWFRRPCATKCLTLFQHTAARRRLGRQAQGINADNRRFNTQPPEGGWFLRYKLGSLRPKVSTHSRPKAAVQTTARIPAPYPVSTHSRPKAAGLNPNRRQVIMVVSTHSRPKAAVLKNKSGWLQNLFQHTAARRRLPEIPAVYSRYLSFNTQPPEGGCRRIGVNVSLI